jgi:hypothetical protein
MAEIIKKVIVPNQSNPEIDWNAEGYLVRYRIKTENKNLTSHWSPIYLVPIETLEQVEGSFFESVGEDEKIISTVVWDDVLSFPTYDVFVAFRGGTLSGDEFEYDEDLFRYHGSTQVHSYSFVKIVGAQNLRIIVQPSTNIKKIKPVFVVFDSDNPVASES